MAERRVLSLLDDLDGGKAVETIRFGLDGREYEIDLSKRNADRLRAALAPYSHAGRRMVRTSRRGGMVAQRRVDVAADPRAVRAWARSNRIKVPERGRLPAALIERYHAAGH